MKIDHKHQKEKKYRKNFRPTSSVISAFIFSPFIWFILLKLGVRVNTALKGLVRDTRFSVSLKEAYIFSGNSVNLKINTGDGHNLQFLFWNNSFTTQMQISIHTAFRAWVLSALYPGHGSKGVRSVCSLGFNHTMSGVLHFFFFFNKDISENCVLSVVMYLSANRTLLAIMYLLVLITFW